MDLYIYDEIGPSWWGLIDAQTVVKSLAEAGDDPVTVHINSPGGDVFEGVAIMNALRSHGVDVVVDGLAASAASIIAMGGQSIAMAQSSMLMIHNPWTIAMGEASDLRKTADTLDKVRDSILSSYSRSGQSEDELRAMLDAETWLSAEEAVAGGFADEVLGKPGVNAKVQPNRYRNTPRRFVQDQQPRDITRAPSGLARQIDLTRRRTGV